MLGTAGAPTPEPAAGERLLANLAVPGTAPREAVAFLLWADHPEEHALGCLRSRCGGCRSRAEPRWCERQRLVQVDADVAGQPQPPATRSGTRRLRLHVLDRVSTWLAGAGRHGAAIEAGLAAVAADPLRESAHRCVVAAGSAAATSSLPASGHPRAPMPRQ